jgi:acyl-lipid omega-6 desaturase (Delta-12 desaturase)
LENIPTVASPPLETTPRRWAQTLARYREPNHVRSIVEIAITAAPLAALWVLAWTALHFGYWWLSLLLAIPAAGFLVRLFMIQHDCGHGSFFSHRMANDWVGRVIGVLTLTPYDFWRQTHAIHHATSGHLERRGIGDVDTLTVREYLSRSFWGRLCYRVYRHPLVMFGVGPAYLFILQYRLPVGLLFNGWPHEDGWSFQEAALHGSSHYDLPGILRWFTANIGVHHVHHLCSRIPSYRLPRVLSEHPELRRVSRLTLLQSFGCVRLVLWDESRQRLVSFREMGRRRNGTAVFCER